MRRLTRVFAATLIFTLPTSVRAAALDATEILPSTVVIYAETTSAEQLLSAVLDHPQRRKVEALPKFQEWLASDDYRRMSMGVKFVESQLGTTWRRAIETIGAGGLHFAVDGKTQGVALIVQSDDVAILEKAETTLVNLSQLAASGNNGGDRLRSVNYRGVTAYRAKEIRFAVVGNWLMITNSSELGKEILDRLLDGASGSLAEEATFRSAHATKPEDAYAWAFANLKPLRSAGVAKKLLGGKSENPGAELILGGVLNTLHKTPYVTAQLASGNQAIELSVAMPHDHAWTPEHRLFFFGSDQLESAPPELALPDTIAEVRAHRGVSGMWLHGPELFNEEINAKLAKANSDLSTVFGGRPFAEEILGSLDGGLRFVAVREPNSQVNADKSAIRLPGFAAIARLTDPPATQRSLRIAFQTAVGFANLTGAQAGRPPLELETQRSANKILLTASYLPDEASDGAEMKMVTSGVGALANLSPTLGFANDSIVIASTRSLATKLLDRLSAIDEPDLGTSSSEAVLNSAVRIRSAALHATLAENRDRLIANNMLEKGHDRATAAQEIDGLLMLLECVDQGNLALHVHDDQLELTVTLAAAQE